METKLQLVKFNGLPHVVAPAMPGWFLPADHLLTDVAVKLTGCTAEEFATLIAPVQLRDDMTDDEYIAAWDRREALPDAGL